MAAESSQDANIIAISSDDSSDTVIYNSDADRTNYTGNRSPLQESLPDDVRSHSMNDQNSDFVAVRSISQPVLRSHQRPQQLNYSRSNNLRSFIESESDSEDDDTMSVVTRLSHRRSAEFRFLNQSQTLARIETRSSSNDERDLFDIAEQANSPPVNRDSPTLFRMTRARLRRTSLLQNNAYEHANTELEIAREESSDSDDTLDTLPLTSDSSDSDGDSNVGSTTSSMINEDVPRSTSPAAVPISLLNTTVSSTIMTETQSDFILPTVPIGQTFAIKRKLSSPEQCKSKKPAMISSPSSNEDDDGFSCPICFEPWTTSGNHRLISLKCGHIFGKKCIERWLKDSHQKCPQCNAKAKRSDIRVIYAKKLIAVDTVDLEHALKIADKERSEKRNHEMELAKVRMQYHMAMEECNRLKSKVSELHSKLATLPNEDQSSSTSSFVPTSSGEAAVKKVAYKLLKSHIVSRSGGCRLMDFHSRTQQFIISQPSPHANFMTGFGVKRLCGNDFKSGSFTLLHQKPIKDLHFSHLTDHHLLSASQDGCLKITDLMSNSKIHEYKVEKPIWSCCWDRSNQNIIYAGLSNGCLMQFDLRNTANHLSSIENLNSRCPIVSLYYVPPTAGESFQGRGGLLTGTLEGASFWQDAGSYDSERCSLIADFKPTFFPFEPGSCTGLQYCHETQHCLVTFRPGRSYRSTTHLLCEIQCRAESDTRTPKISCNIVDTYTGGNTHRMLTRNSLFVLPQNDQSEETLLACVGDEAEQKVKIYNPNHAQLMQSLDSDGGPPLDIHPVHVDSTPPMLAILSHTTLNVYKLA